MDEDLLSSCPQWLLNGEYRLNGPRRAGTEPRAGATDCRCSMEIFNQNEVGIRAATRVRCAGFNDSTPSAILYLTNYLGYIIISEKTYSTVQVAKLLEITPATLHRWIREKRIEPPPLQSLAGMEVRVWNAKNVAEVRKYKVEHYWGRGNKKPRRKNKK